MARKKKNAKRQQCSKPGCRRLRVTEEYCEEHQDEIDAALNPIDHVIRLSEMDRLRFVEVDNEVRTASQQIKILQLEQEQDSMKYTERRTARQGLVNTHSANIDALQRDYKRLMQEFGEKHGFNPAHVSIDDKTGVIREEKPKEPKEKPKELDGS